MAAMAEERDLTVVVTIASPLVHPSIPDYGLDLRRSRPSSGSNLHRTRASIRRDQRDGLSAGPVRLLLLRLRRAATVQGAPSDDAAAREFTCRWMVRGHWRQQWYPSRGVHRPIWINPHIKGPDDKPLRTGESVHIWDR